LLVMRTAGDPDTLSYNARKMWEGTVRGATPANSGYMLSVVQFQRMSSTSLQTLLSME
jgi:hypothetical protein